MTFELFTRAVLRIDIPFYSLKTGDVVTIVDAHSGTSTQEQGYSVEVFSATGDTLAVVTLPESSLEPLKNSEILHVRQFQRVAEPGPPYSPPEKK